MNTIFSGRKMDRDWKRLQSMTNAAEKKLQKQKKQNRDKYAEYGISLSYDAHDAYDAYLYVIRECMSISVFPRDGESITLTKESLKLIMAAADPEKSGGYPEDPEIDNGIKRCAESKEILLQAAEELQKCSREQSRHRKEKRQFEEVMDQDSSFPAGSARLKELENMLQADSSWNGETEEEKRFVKVILQHGTLIRRQEQLDQFVELGRQRVSLLQQMYEEDTQSLNAEVRQHIMKWGEVMQANMQACIAEQMKKLSSDQ